MSVKPIPEGYHTATPYLAVDDAAEALEYYKKAFGAVELMRMAGPNDMVMHAEIKIGDSVVMCGDAGGPHPAMPAAFSLYVDTGEAVDATYKRALDNGAKSVVAPQNAFYGYRSATVQDPGGNRWTICAIVEQLSREDIEKRMASQPH